MLWNHAVEATAMTIRDALVVYLSEKGYRDPDTPEGQLYKDDWFHFYIGHRNLKIFKLGSTIHSLALHDAHHMLTGYQTDMQGEAELVGWELASGGCGRHWVMWIDRIFAIPLMLACPRASLRAIRRGRHEQNLYSMAAPHALDLQIDDVRSRMRDCSLRAV
jgi:hypothetical protein